MRDKKIFFKIKRPYVFVPMCLDFLHHGHINILKKANKYGNIILGLVSDKAIESYKKKKPVTNFKNRKKIALMLKNVSHVMKVNAPKYFPHVVKKYKFEYIVHGDDWKRGPQAESRKKLIIVMRSWKGKVIDVPYTKKISSTILKKKKFINV
jgi:phosphoenolpyruvate phosphomutase / 2-hydroxyethylphosphonate cytidylyltransferase